MRNPRGSTMPRVQARQARSLVQTTGVLLSLEGRIVPCVSRTAGNPHPATHRQTNRISQPSVPGCPPRQVHGTVLLTKRHDIVKSYPHSLIESLVATKPVILSDTIPMADYVRGKDCGIVLEALDLEAFGRVLREFMARYKILKQNTERIPPDSFSLEAMTARYQSIYRLNPLRPL